MATTESADRDVVVLFGVPGPCSLGVVGSDGGGGTDCVSKWVNVVCYYLRFMSMFGLLLILMTPCYVESCSAA